MAEEFSAKVESTEVQQKLDELSAKFGDLRPVMKAIGEYMLLKTDEVFRTETSPYGDAWKPLNPEYRAYKTASGGIDKILQFRGLLRNIIYQVSGDSVSVGTDRAYGATQQFGAVITPKNSKYLAYKTGNPARVTKSKRSVIPARPFLPTNGLPADYESGILDAIADALEVGSSA